MHSNQCKYVYLLQAMSIWSCLKPISRSMFMWTESRGPFGVAAIDGGGGGGGGGSEEEAFGRVGIRSGEI